VRSDSSSTSSCSGTPFTWMRRSISSGPRGTRYWPTYVARLSPLSFKHINMLGRYAFTLSDTVAKGELRLRPQDEVNGTTFKHRIAEIHAISMKRLLKVEAADDPSDGADDE
jgi:hypothetical protein